MISDPVANPVRIGVIGLGRAFVLMLPAFRSDPRIRLVAACAPRRQSRDTFAEEFGGRTHAEAEAFFSDPEIEAVYVATPHQLHRNHVVAAAAAGKHVLVDKPLAITMQDGQEMVSMCKKHGVQLVVGPSHSFDGPVQLARQLIERGEFGRVGMIHAFNYTDFLYRPRRPDELDTKQGGGVVFSQGVHQVDVVRLLAGSRARTVTAITGNWDKCRSTEGAFSALIAFEDGAFASLTYSGYAHFDSDEWMNWRGELGNAKDPASYGSARRQLEATGDEGNEVRLKSTRTYGGGHEPPRPVGNEHFGPIIVSCEGGDLRLVPDGVEIYGTNGRDFIEAPFDYPRRQVIDALVAAVRQARPPQQNGPWGLASLEICHAILGSAHTGNPVMLKHQMDLENS